MLKRDLTVVMDGIEEPLTAPIGNTSLGTSSLKKKKSITRLFTTSLSRRSSRSRPPSSDGGQTPPTPDIPADFMSLAPKTSTVPRIPTMTFDGFKNEALVQEKAEQGHSVAVQKPGIASTSPGRQAMRDLNANPKVKAKGTSEPRRAISSGHVHHRVAAHTTLTVEAGYIQEPTKPTIRHAATHPITTSGVKTGLRKPSAFASLPRGRGASFTAPKSKSSPLQPQPSRSLTGGGDDVSKPTGKRRPSVKSIGHDGASFPFPSFDDVPQLPQRPWQADLSSDEVRLSLLSALTTSSSHMETYSTDRSSVFTKGTSVAESTVDLPSRPVSKAGGMTVDDAIDMYAAGFADDDEVELGESKDTSMSEEEHRRSMRIAEAINDSMGGITTPTRRTTAESASTYTIISGDAFRNSSSPPPPILPPNSTRDQYGFLKASHHVTVQQHDAWWNEYSRGQERRKTKWTSYMRDYALPTYLPTRFPKRSEKTERFVRKGLPPAWRGPAWFYYAGGQDYLDKHPRQYRSLVLRAEAELPSNDQEAIERDLHRTFPDNIHFKPDSPTTEEQPLLTSLRRVLRAFALHCPCVGYCQSLNFIAGLLLLFLPEEKAFWMLHIITTVYLPGTHEISLEGANVDLWVLMVALKGTMPGIWAKIGSAGTPGDDLTGNARLPPISLCTTSWFMSLFIGTLPIESVLRVWDVLFYEGSRVLFRVALTIFKLGEQRIRDIGDSMELFQVVQTLPKDMLDAGSFMRAVCRRGGVSSDWVELRRWERREWYAKEKANATFLKDDDNTSHYFESKGEEVQLRRKDSLWKRRKRKGSEPAPPSDKELLDMKISVVGRKLLAV